MTNPADVTTVLVTCMLEQIYEMINPGDKPPTMEETGFSGL